MSFTDLQKDIGTAKDNGFSPIHNWYRFTAGFSYKLVDRIIDEEHITNKDRIFDSFAGCGTTLVSAQKRGISAVGNESQELLYDVIRAKLNWNIDKNKITQTLSELESKIGKSIYRGDYHLLLRSLYSENNLNQLYVIRDHIAEFDTETQLFLKLALTQTLHKVSIHPIAVPYISRSKYLANTLSGFEMFKKTVLKMLDDLNYVSDKKITTEIYFQDSRIQNISIGDASCKICITSPPYLNNLDYGEVSKVCTHFYGITNDWSDITGKVRKRLVTGATTHYNPSEFDLEEWCAHPFYSSNKQLIDELLPKIERIKAQSQIRSGHKRFDILILYYLEDMYNVLLEIRRVVKRNGKAFLVLGDSAPYGVHIETTNLLGRMAIRAGFKNYRIITIRQRGTKWKTLKNRHSLLLSENLLILE